MMHAQFPRIEKVCYSHLYYNLSSTVVKDRTQVDRDLERFIRPGFGICVNNEDCCENSIKQALNK
ncbi:hypothetical protein HPP92_028115 [Vanilla planifolia]|uniref:Uncharacterized protein n=1 Tax=Vanilla planifolia TaxID=51239 RepID=A0A835U6E7_VANPL|nr:hypothetical protein HPP92_028115 [Vanilla planifolia]